jgi:hypothetical protein
MIEHLRRSQDRLSRLEDGQHTNVHCLNLRSSQIARADAKDEVRAATLTEIRVHPDRTELFLDLRDQA